MANLTWETQKTCFCQHVGADVALEAQVVYPADWLSEQPVRVHAHRCSRGLDCNLSGKTACALAGTNPLIEPVFS